MFKTTVQPVQVREFREDDFPAVRTLWRDDAQWGDLTAETWRKWYVDIPHGPAIIAVAEQADGRIIGQAAMTPCRAVVDGVEREVVHLAAPIVSRQAQSLTLRLDHPVIGLLTGAAKLAKQRGVAAVMGMPRRAWLPICRLAPLVGMPRFPGVALGCAEARIREESPPRARGVARRIERFGAEFDELWAQAQRNLPIVCGVRRDAGYLNYRNGGHLCLEIRGEASGDLVGYSAVRHDGLITDMLARDETGFRDVLAATWSHMASIPRDEPYGQIRLLKAMVTPLLDEPLKALGFRRNRFEFAFACCVLDRSLTRRMATSRWYLTPNG